MCGVFHVVAISIIRYITLSKLSKTTSPQPWFTYARCWKSLGIIYGSVLFICIPLYFHSQVVEAVEDESCISRYPYLSGRVNYRLSFAANQLLQVANFWLFGSICKIIPCLILCVMSVLLIGSLTKIREISSRFSSVARDRQHHRTTKIILVSLLLHCYSNPLPFFHAHSNPLKNTFFDFCFHLKFTKALKKSLSEKRYPTSKRNLSL